MKFLILIQSNPESRALWDELTDEQRMDLGLGHRDLTRELADEGVLVASAGLQGPETAYAVARRGDRPVVRGDGPFAEAKEYLAGFHLVEVRDLGHAAEIAARVPDAAFREVEVRPLFDLAGLEP